MTTNDEARTTRSFKVEDRRRFSETGEPRAETAATEARPDTPPASEGQPASATAPSGAAEDVPPITFLSFVLGLGTQALALLGEVPHPETGQVQTDLPGAKNLIDILGLLEEKTRGNLDETEVKVLEQMLYDLRLKYVERARPR